MTRRTRNNEPGVLLDTGDGLIRIEVEHLLKARVTVRHDPRMRTLQLVVTFHDSGIPGEPQIDIDGDDYCVSIRPYPKEDNSVLGRAERKYKTK